MKKLLKYIKFPFIICGIVGLITGLFLWIYLCVIPSVVSSEAFQNFVDKKLSEQFGIHAVFDEVSLKTSLKPQISLIANDFELTKDGKTILVLKNFDSKINFSQIFLKKISIKKLGADYIFADINKILELSSKEEEKKEPFDWTIDILDSELYLKNLKVIYLVNGVNIDAQAKNINIDKLNKAKSFVHFDFSSIVKKGKYVVNVKVADNNKIFIQDKKLFANNTVIYFNNSKLYLDGWAKDNQKYKFNVSAKEFDISNIVSVIETDLLIPNGSEMLTYFDNIEGDFDFDLVASEKGLDGNIKLHHLCFILIPIENVPVHIHNGLINIDKKNIYLKNFSGYYGTRPVNTLSFYGRIDDYIKSFKTTIWVDGVVADDFAKYYLSPVIGVPVGIVGKADTKVIIKYFNNVVNLKWFFRVSPEDNLLVGGAPITPYKEDRVVISDMSIIGTKLKIKNLNYYVTVPGVKDFYRRKLISLHGLIDFAKGVDFRVMGFEIEQPVPSQFLNLIIRQEIFKNGTAVGKLTAVDGPKGVKLFGNLTLDKIAIPSQRLLVDSANLTTNFDTINIKASGGYRRSKYSLTGNMVNNIAFPLIVNNLDFTLDSIDVEKLLNSFNQQGDGKTHNAVKEENLSEEAPTFDFTNIIIKDCNLHLGKAVYGDLVAENISAKLTMDKNGDLDIDSNKFDFAGGYSSAHVCCDLKEHEYHVRLGVKDIDSNLIATTLLNLPKEISGKASGIMDLRTDDSMKLNGNLKFIIKDGTIGKIGLIEYVLNVASVFRNPLAMISPMIIFDLVNVPDGKFDKIQGSLDINDNLVDNIKIKSFAQYISAYIVGKYDLERKDAALRVYTKFSNKKKGVYGFLRNISLRNVAQRVSLGARNDVNYYSSDISELPDIDADEKDTQLFVTKIDGDLESNNFLSSLKKLR